MTIYENGEFWERLSVDLHNNMIGELASMPFGSMDGKMLHIILVWADVSFNDRIEEGGHTVCKKSCSYVIPSVMAFSVDHQLEIRHLFKGKPELSNHRVTNFEVKTVERSPEDIEHVLMLLMLAKSA